MTRGSLAGVALALLVMEALVRQVYHRPLSHDPEFGLVIRPGATVVWRIEGDGISRWSPRGIRGARPADPAQRPLLVLGSSQTEALQVDDDEVYSALVERGLADGGAPLAVRNAGKSGASAADYAAWADLYQRVFAPRRVVIQLAPVDLGEDAWTGTGATFVRDEGGALRALPRPVRARGPWQTRVADAVNHSMLLVYGAYRFSEFRAAQAAQPPLFSAGAAAPAGPAAVAPERDDPIESELDLLRAAYRGRVTFLFTPDVDVSAPGRPPGRIEQRFTAWCAATAASCANARPGYLELAARGRSPFGFDNTRFGAGHLNAEGHRATAAALLQELDRLRALELL